MSVENTDIFVFEQKEFIYSQRTWLVPEHSHVTDTCSYIFCHYGMDATGSSRNFIKIAGCEDIITYDFGQTSIAKTIKFIDCLLSVITGVRKKSKISDGNGWTTYSIEKKIYPEHSSLLIRKTHNKGRESKSGGTGVWIMGDEAHGGEEILGHKLFVLEINLKNFKAFLETKKRSRTKLK